MFVEHEKTAMRSTLTSFRAGKVRNCMLQTIEANKKIIPAFDEAVSKFDKTCARVLKEETIRLEEERLHAEAVAANAGKELDFFEDPTLLTAIRAESKNMQKTYDEPIRRTKTVAPKKLGPRWNFF